MPVQVLELMAMLNLFKEICSSLRNVKLLLALKGTATLIISRFCKKGLLKPWILIAVSSKSVEKWGSNGRLNNSIWPTLSRHFEYLFSFQNFYKY